MWAFNSKTEYDFGEKNRSKLENSIFKLKDILKRNGFSIYNEQLNNILASVYQKEPEKFENYTLTNLLWGGSGAMWEISIQDSSEMKNFNKTLIEFISSLRDIGINKAAINQIYNLKK